ncbi:hatching enzyme 1.2 [Eurosta solidaginis]|uniref:hatching enzyme 1.2 n=1 Tax=Eurosta solidaginis TaxID=178769 RepID=UPI0035312719
MLNFFFIAFLTICVVQVKGSTTNTNTEVSTSKSDKIDLTHFGSLIYGAPVQLPFDLLTKLNETPKWNPEELGLYHEGDLLVPNDKKPNSRNGLIAYSTRWPRAIVPYEIRGRFSDNDLSIIQHAFQQYHNRTCVRFKPRYNERDYIVLTSDSTGCWSSIGRLGGRQVVNLQSSLCFRHNGTTMHELMHALGFLHEHNRHERDSFIRVLIKNVKNGLMSNFEKGSPRDQYGFGVPYDYASVMHYSKTSFSKNGQPTIEALRNTKESKMMGQRTGFSNSDVAKLNAMYKCR